MNAPELPALIADLARAYPNRIDQEIYTRDLADIPRDVLWATIRDTVRTAREWPPSVGDLREAAAARLLAIPDEREAIRQIEARIRWGRTSGDTPLPELHPLAREAVAHVGGWHSLRMSDRPDVTRGQLLRYYRETRQYEIRRAATGDLGALTPA